MGKVKRLFKGINLAGLEQKVAEVAQAVYEAEQMLEHLQNDLAQRHTTLSQCKQKKRFCEEELKRINTELSTTSDATKQNSASQ